MSIAGDRISSFKNSKDKQRIINKIIGEASFKLCGDDTLYYFKDDSILIHRKIVNELQLFKGWNHEKITNGIINSAII